MCHPEDLKVNEDTTSDEAAKMMCDLLKTHCKVNIDPKDMKNFLRTRWGRVSIIAHRIHEGSRQELGPL